MPFCFVAVNDHADGFVWAEDEIAGHRILCIAQKQVSDGSQRFIVGESGE